MTPKGLCTKCRRGYLVAEQVSSTKEVLYYCNNCFKYADKPAAKKAHLEEAEKAFELWDDDDLDAYVESLFELYVD